MILAHFTGNDFSSSALVVGIALVVLGARAVSGGDGRVRRRGARQLVAGALAIVAGGGASWLHTGT